MHDLLGGCRDLAVYGDECKFGGGKVLREGMGQATNVPAAESLDYVITNALILDVTGKSTVKHYALLSRGVSPALGLVLQQASTRLILG